MKDYIKIIFEKLKENRRYFWVFAALVLVFSLNRSFPAKVITSESCKDGKCKTAIENPSLTDDAPSFYVNDAFKSKPDEYYRLIFQIRSNKKTAVDFFVTNPLDQDKEIKNFTIEKSGANFIQETIFKSDKEYSDLLFKKTEPSDGADVFIDQVRISKLNVANERELANLMPTIMGGADTEITDQAQGANDYAFKQLREPEVLFGQVFVPQMDYITGVSLDMDITKQSNGGGKKYSLELRRVDMENDIPDVKSNPLAVLKFSVDDLEKYRQEDGKFMFPFFTKLEPGTPYFIGINNDKADVNGFNYLTLKGTNDGKKYPQGNLVVKYKGDSYATVGSLYFKTYGFELKRHDNVAVLLGSIIEDLGKGEVQFAYRQAANEYETINLDSRSEDIYFDNDSEALAGKISEKKDSYFTYKFETIYPFRSFSLSGSQSDPFWNKIKLSYSFDKKNWQAILPENLKDANGHEYQNFNFKFSAKQFDGKEVYVKVEPERDKYPEQLKFGLKNFEFKADLLNK